eukprot:s1352_g9.t1
MTEIVVKDIDKEESNEPVKELETVPEEEPKEEKPEEVIEKPVEEKPTPAPKPKRVRPSRAKPPFDPENFKKELVQQLKEEMTKEMTARDAYYRAKEEKSIAQREKLKSLVSKIL